jgi:hypothetical protein
MTRQRRAGLELSLDSFLDIVANMVGILIIFIVVLGTQSRDAAEESVHKATLESPEAQDFQSAASQMLAARQAVDRQRAELAAYENETLSRRRERNVLLDLIAIAREKWDEKKSDLSIDQQQAAELAAAIATRERDLQQLAGQRSQLENSQNAVVTVEHLPSPMAKTVFGEEIHFRLKGGLLSVVPIDPLVELIREEFRRGANGTRPGAATATVGPVRGYVARYDMDKTRAVVNRNGAVSTGIRMELTNMTIEPASEPYGDPLAACLASDRSLIEIELAGRDPRTTTVTVWVYPDSFGEFRQLKEYLYSRGIAAAARPLPMGRPISGGPQGSRSAAQ